MDWGVVCGWVVHGMRSCAAGYVGDLNGECIGCGAVGVAGGQCLSCGAPVEPWDGSFHYDFGWVDGPRPESE